MICSANVEDTNIAKETSPLKEINVPGKIKDLSWGKQDTCIFFLILCGFSPHFEVSH